MTVSLADHVRRIVSAHAANDQEIGRNVRRCRLAAGLSQQFVADRVPGWRQTLVSKVENGQRPLAAREAAILTYILDCTASDLIGGAA